MPRKMKITTLRYENYEVRLTPSGWYVSKRDSGAETAPMDIATYPALKRIWRKSKHQFDAICRAMDFENLFSRRGIKL